MVAAAAESLRDREKAAEGRGKGGGMQMGDRYELNILVGEEYQVVYSLHES